MVCHDAKDREAALHALAGTAQCLHCGKEFPTQGDSSTEFCNGCKTAEESEQAKGYGFVVVCREDAAEGGIGGYTLATRQVFTNLSGAYHCAAGINEARQPLVVSGRWFQLRMEENRR